MVTGESHTLGAAGKENLVHSGKIIMRFYPYYPCVVYLPTFTIIYHQIQFDVVKYSIHGWCSYGLMRIFIILHCAQGLDRTQRTILLSLPKRVHHTENEWFFLVVYQWFAKMGSG